MRKDIRPILDRRYFETIFTKLWTDRQEKAVGRFSLAAVESTLASIRSIAISVVLILIGVLFIFAFGGELFSSDIYIDVDDVSKGLLEKGMSSSLVGEEIANQLNELQMPPQSESGLLRADLAFILNNDNKTKLLPQLPETTQPLLIHTVEAVPQFVIPRTELDVRSIFSFFRAAVGRRNNRIFVALTDKANGQLELRLRLVRGNSTKFFVAEGGSLEDAVRHVADSVAISLFPKRYLLALFAQESHMAQRKFERTRRLIHDLLQDAAGDDQVFLKTVYGDVAYENGSYREAASIYQSIVSEGQPKVSLLAYRISQSLIAAGSIEKGVKAVEDFKDTDLESLHENLLMVYVQALQHGDLSEDDEPNFVQKARKEAEYLDKNFPNSPAANNLIGVFNYQLGDVRKAEFHFRKAISLDNLYASAHNNLGTIFLGRKDYGSALLQFELATSEDDQSGPAELNEGNALEGLERWAESAQKFKRAAELDPRNPVCHTCWVNSLINVNDFEDGMQVIEDGLRKNPDDGTLFLMWGTILDRKGCYADAVRKFESAEAAEDPRLSKTLLLHRLGNALRESGKPEAAKKVFAEEAVRYSFSSSLGDQANTISLRRAIARADAGQIAEALQEFDDGNVFDLDSEDRSDIYSDWSGAMLAAGRIDSALDAAREGIHADKTSPDAHAALGTALLRKGDAASASDAFELAKLLGGARHHDWQVAWETATRRLGRGPTKLSPPETCR